MKQLNVKKLILSNIPYVFTRSWVLTTTVRTGTP